MIETICRIDLVLTLHDASLAVNNNMNYNVCINLPPRMTKIS